EDELRTLLEGVSAANLIRRHRLGVTVLQAYSISRQLVRTACESTPGRFGAGNDGTYGTNGTNEPCAFASP
ncbi:MAG TPA: hypothetical protein VGF69_01835, partial [Thermoanaerobaculia bacterium]